jgi:hypothetical protein
LTLALLYLLVASMTFTNDMWAWYAFAFFFFTSPKGDESEVLSPRASSLQVASMRTTHGLPAV